MTNGVVVASNRGPVGWRTRTNGTLVARRGTGGLVTALASALRNEAGTWVSVALSDTDRRVAAAHPDAPFEQEADGWRLRLRLLDLGEGFDAYYDEISNRLLWFTLHQLWGEPYQPTGIGWRAAWEAYATANERVARAVVDVAGASGATEVHVHDYHLCVASAVVRRALPDAAMLHYVHTPWVGPDYLARLPDAMVDAVLRGLLSADVVAFSSPVWAGAFRRCAEELAGAEIDGEWVLLGDRRTRVADLVIGVDEATLANAAGSEPVVDAGERLDAELGGRRLILRVDRTDLSKNILRGLHAYELLLERHPEHLGGVWHYAHLTPSRQGVAEYRDYLGACQLAASRIQERFGSDAVTLAVTEDYPRALAALGRYDVLLTNPVVDGTNLVAKEGPVLNTRDGVVVLSRAAGAAFPLREAALLVNPYDVEAQADALQAALTMGADERRGRARAARSASLRGAPRDWFAEQRAILRRTVEHRRHGD
jgi:trehalose 6-phosphate synthase